MRINLYLAICALSMWVCPLRAAAQFERTDTAKEVELGRQVGLEVERRYQLSHDAAAQERVKRIGAALLSSLDSKAYTYEFKVLAVNDFNAFCLPGGKMYVYDGLLTRLHSDDAVAFVMAHEITHAAHRHWAHHIDKMKGITILSAIASINLGTQLVANITSALLSAQYSREQEDDADRTGLELAWSAGFDPDGAAEASKTIKELDKGSHVPAYLRDHPAAGDRMKKLAAEAVDLKRKTRPGSANRTAPAEHRSDFGCWRSSRCSRQPQCLVSILGRPIMDLQVWWNTIDIHISNCKRNIGRKQYGLSR